MQPPKALTRNPYEKAKCVGRGVVMSWARGFWIESEGWHKGRGGDVICSRLDSLHCVGMSMRVPFNLNLSDLPDDAGVHEAFFFSTLPLFNMKAMVFGQVHPVLETGREGDTCLPEFIFICSKQI